MAAEDRLFGRGAVEENAGDWSLDLPNKGGQDLDLKKTVDEARRTNI